jgi:DNA-directed RNA polymerase
VCEALLPVVCAFLQWWSNQTGGYLYAATRSLRLLNMPNMPDYSEALADANVYQCLQTPEILAPIRSHCVTIVCLG